MLLCFPKSMVDLPVNDKSARTTQLQSIGLKKLEEVIRASGFLAPKMFTSSGKKTFPLESDGQMTQKLSGGSTILKGASQPQTWSTAEEIQNVFEDIKVATAQSWTKHWNFSKADIVAFYQSPEGGNNSLADANEKYKGVWKLASSHMHSPKQRSRGNQGNSYSADGKEDETPAQAAEPEASSPAKSAGKSYAAAASVPADNSDSKSTVTFTDSESTISSLSSKGSQLSKAAEDDLLQRAEQIKQAREAEKQALLEELDDDAVLAQAAAIQRRKAKKQSKRARAAVAATASGCSSESGSEAEPLRTI
jgi:hypothetical protein